LVLIRWVGMEIRIFAYLGNLVLVMCFFGVGLGCYQADRPVAHARLGLNILLLAVLVANPFHVEWLNLKWTTLFLSNFDDSLLWQVLVGGTAWHVVAGLVIVAVLLYLVTMTFVPVGQVLGRALADHPRAIRAYSINIAGSLAGVWLFNGLSWWSQPPVVWFGVVAGLVGALALVQCQRQLWLATGLTALATVAVGWGVPPTLRTVWSPYHKLTLEPLHAKRGTNQIAQGYRMEVNGTFFQEMRNLSPEFFQSHPGDFDQQLARRGAYDLPFAFRQKIDRLLVVGAGSGNNAAAALRHGAQQVDCVEIDPAIAALGRELHPEHPYDSPHVQLVINDARAYFKQARGPYDIIWFGWLDSHTLGSSYNNLRLDHYVYTEQSFREAKHLLARDGILIVNFAAERRWIADRLFAVLRRVFGHDPLVYAVPDFPVAYGGGGNNTMIIAAQPITLDLVKDDDLRAFIKSALIELPGTTRPTTDDWPYLYLQQAHIPKLHWLTSLTILATVAVAQRRAFGTRRGVDGHFFALGAAFLLLEVQTVSHATLLFGMTWVVNAIVISAVLVMILLANLVATRWPRLPQWFIVTGLAITLAALAAVPLDWFNTLPALVKVLTASAFLTAPVFFSGLIFIRSFAACADKSRALGSNLIGALVGGLLESLAFITGMRALVILVGMFYLLALLLRPASRGKVEVMA
jgi:spermidine synthase